MKQILPKILFGLSIVALAAVIFIVIKGSKNPSLKGEASLSVKNGEKIVIDEYSDFQCPACAQAAPVLEELRQKYPDKIEINFHHFPLPYHRLSKKAAEASEAAREQGKFWEYHDLLFKKQDEWSKAENTAEFLKKYARDLKLDVKKFEQDLNSGKYLLKIEESVKEGNEKKIEATPTFFVNGQKITGFKNWEEFKKAVEEKMK